MKPSKPYPKEEIWRSTYRLRKTDSIVDLIALTLLCFSPPELNMLLPSCFSDKTTTCTSEKLTVPIQPRSWLYKTALEGCISSTTALIVFPLKDSKKLLSVQSSFRYRSAPLGLFSSDQRPLSPISASTYALRYSSIWSQLILSPRSLASPNDNSSILMSLPSTKTYPSSISPALRSTTKGRSLPKSNNLYLRGEFWEILLMYIQIFNLFRWLCLPWEQRFQWDGVSFVYSLHFLYLEVLGRGLGLLRVLRCKAH